MLTFEYGSYLRECFSQPVLNMLWTLPCVLLFFLPALPVLRGNRTSSNPSRTALRILLIALSLVVIGVPLYKQIGTLVHTNGFAILQDRGAQPVTLTGDIEAIRQADQHADTRFTHNGEHHYGTWLTIGDEQYFAVTAGSLTVGDAVTLEYLPKSRCVLSLAPADATTQED